MKQYFKHKLAPCRGRVMAYSGFREIQDFRIRLRVAPFTLNPHCQFAGFDRVRPGLAKFGRRVLASRQTDRY